MEIRKNSKRPVEGKEQGPRMPPFAKHCPVSAKAGPSPFQARAGLDRRCRPPSPQGLSAHRRSSPWPQRPAPGSAPSCRQASPSHRRNGLGLLRRVEGNSKGGRGRALSLLPRGVDTRVHHARGVGMRPTFPGTPLFESGPLAKMSSPGSFEGTP